MIKSIHKNVVAVSLGMLLGCQTGTDDLKSDDNSALTGNNCLDQKVSFQTDWQSVVEGNQAKVAVTLTSPDGANESFDSLVTCSVLLSFADGNSEVTCDTTANGEANFAQWAYDSQWFLSGVLEEKQVSGEGDLEFAAGPIKATLSGHFVEQTVEPNMKHERVFSIEQKQSFGVSKRFAFNGNTEPRAELEGLGAIVPEGEAQPVISSQTSSFTTMLDQEAVDPVEGSLEQSVLFHFDRELTNEPVKVDWIGSGCGFPKDGFTAKMVMMQELSRAIIERVYRSAIPRG